jgi:hypothetical protein
VLKGKRKHQGILQLIILLKDFESIFVSILEKQFRFNFQQSSLRFDSLRPLIPYVSVFFFETSNPILQWGCWEQYFDHRVSSCLEKINKQFSCMEINFMLVWYVVMKQTARYWIFRYNYSLTRNWTGNSNDNQSHKKNYKDILTWKTQGFRWHVYIKIFNNFNWNYFLSK